METYTYPTSHQPRIRLYACEDNVTILGVDSSTIELSTSADQADTAIRQTEEEFRIERIEERLILRVPRGAQIEVEQQGGDVTIHEVASVRLTDVGGDVKLRSIAGSVQLDSIQGDLLVERAETITGQYIAGDARCMVAASLQLDEIAGDARVIDVAAVQIRHISGDAQISGAHDRCQIDIVEGSLKIRTAGTIAVQTIAGDLVAEQFGALEIESVEGDCTISSNEGAATINSINGDMSARVQQGPLQVTRIDGDARIDGAAAGLTLGCVDGDLNLRLEPTGSAVYHAHVSGDALLSLPASCDLTLEAQVAGDISGMNNGRGRRQNSPVSAVFGTGTAQLTLTIDGDLTLRGAALRAQPRPMPIPRVPAPPAPPVPALPATGATVRLQPDPPRRPGQAEARDEERLALLRLLAEGRISIEEADQLLATVDNQPERTARVSTDDHTSY